MERFGASPVTRLVDSGLLTPQALLAHVGHLAWPELAQVLPTGAWLVHTPRSNMDGRGGLRARAEVRRAGDARRGQR